jgi:O-antigen/teichoic acid export membrane protein
MRTTNDIASRNVWKLKVRWIASPAFESSSRVVGPLAFSTVAFGGYIVVAIGVGRARRTQFNWVVTGAAAVINVALNFLLIPPYGMMGAAVATIAAYTTMFVGMSWWSQQIYRVPYQWRRVATAVAVGVALVVAGKPALAKELAQLVDRSEDFVAHLGVFAVLEQDAHP